MFTITAGKAVMRPDGSFAGYAVAAIDPDLQHAARSLDLRPDMRTLLIHGAGRVIHCVPRDARIRGAISTPAARLPCSGHMQSGERKSLITA